MRLTDEKLDEIKARSYRSRLGIPVDANRKRRAEIERIREAARSIGNGHRKNHLEHGVCTIKVRRCADASQTTMAWIEGLIEQLGLRRMPQ